MRARRAEAKPLLACDAAHVAAELDELPHHVRRRAADGRRDLEHGLHQLRVDLRLELVPLDRRENRVDVLDEVEGRAVEQLVLLLYTERVRVALAEAVVEHARAAVADDAGLAEDVGRDDLLARSCTHGITASASISTFQDGSRRDVTTQVAAGLVSPNASPCARATSAQCARSVTNIRVRTTSASDDPARSSASAMISRQSRAWS